MDVVGVREVEVDGVVGGLSVVVETGVTKGVGVVLVVVDVVEGVYDSLVS